MISKKMQDAMNEQVKAEFYSAYLYLSMSAYLESIDLPGLANWMRVQYQEEVTHAEKIYDHVIERDGRAIVKSWDSPLTDWESPLDLFEAAYKHEQLVTSLINKLVDTAIAEHDHASQIFLQWFVNEQVEEEASVKAVIQQFKLLGDSRAGLFQIDRELGQRVFTPPAATQGA
ncbi:MAG: ferritin [candidate division Zixibacteria bacterium]|nr:ferritin [candidate division Zixibacteria bacterium]